MGYFLISARLGFRCWSEDDFPLAMELWGNFEVMAMMGGPISPAAVKTRLAQEIARMRDPGIQYWPFFLLENGAFAGCAGLRPREHEAPIDGLGYQMGYHLLPAFWGRGIATEAAQAVIDHAFGTLGVEALYAAHHPLNQRSASVLLKLGFEAVGEELYPPTGLMHPTYRLLRDSSSSRRCDSLPRMEQIVHDVKQTD